MLRPIVKRMRLIQLIYNEQYYKIINKKGSDGIGRHE